MTEVFNLKIEEAVKCTRDLMITYFITGIMMICSAVAWLYVYFHNTTYQKPYSIIVFLLLFLVTDLIILRVANMIMNWMIDRRAFRMSIKLAQIKHKYKSKQESE